MLSSSGIPSAAAADGVRFKSPGGRFEVAFEEVEHRTYSEAEQQRDLSRTSNVKYRISFFKVGRQEAVATVEYCDVYGWEKSAKPAPVSDLFQAILWSPKEDFAVLDEEGWARAPGAPERKAVALNPALSWSTAPFRLSDLVWADPLRVIGNAHDDCHYSVGLFDGRTGQTQALQEPQSPIGYEIRTVIGRKVLIQRLLDNCKTEESERAFVPACLSLDLDSIETTAVPCEAFP